MRSTVNNSLYLSLCSISEKSVGRQITDASGFLGYHGELHTEYDKEVSERLKRPMYRVTKAFRFYFDTDEGRMWVFVPEGFLTDGATVPKFLHWIISPWGKHGQAAVIHDLLCIYRTVFHFDYGKSDISPKLISNYWVHRVFLEAMVVADVGWLKRTVMYWAVKGYFFFKRLRNQGPQEPIDKKQLRAIYRERGLIK